MRKSLLILFVFLGTALQGAVYDCCLFFDEIELLKLRFEELYNVVDYFVIVESKTSLTGKDKPLFFDENREMFSKYQNKIVHLVIDSFPFTFIDIDPDSPFQLMYENEDFWTRENYSRDFILNALKDCKDTDTIFISNVNEVPRAASVKEIDNYLNGLNQKRSHSDVHQNLFVCQLGLKWLAYYMNRENPQIWIGGCKAVPYWFLKTHQPWEVRIYHLVHHDPKKFMDAGWYFDTMGGEKRALYKWQNNEVLFDKEMLERLSADDNLLKNTLNKMLSEYTIDSKINRTYPRYFLNNLEYFHSIGWFYQQ